MTSSLKHLVLFYALLFITFMFMASSALYFPYITPEEQKTYFQLAISAILLFLPLLFIISLFKLGSHGSK